MHFCQNFCFVAYFLIYSPLLYIFPQYSEVSLLGSHKSNAQLDDKMEKGK